MTGLDEVGCDYPGKRVCRKMLMALVGERDISTTEAGHQLFSTPMTMSSEDFVVQSLQAERKVKVDASEGGAKVEKNMLDIYGARLSKKGLTVGERETLTNMNFQSFVANNKPVPGGGGFQRREKEAIVIFFPRPSGTIGGKQYLEYCRLSLIKFKPWQGKVESAWGGSDNSPELIVEAWETFKKSRQFQELGVSLLADREELEEIRDQERAEAEFLEQSLD